MTARPTIKTICAQTGLSTATVSKALRNSETVRKETRDLVQKVARDLGYATNMHGVSLVTGRTYQVAVIMTAPDADADEWEGVEYAQLLSGISHALESSLYRVALYAVHDFAEAVETIRRIVVNRQADGVILSGTRPDDGRVKILMDADFPFVSYGTTTAHGAHAFVDADNAGIIAASLARLAERGHRRIALLNPPSHLSYAVTRRAAYEAGLAAHGLGVDPALVAEGQLTPAFGLAQVSAMSALSDPPTAYICANEAAALGALAGFNENGLVHGRDAVILATDDLNVSAYFTPPLTTFYLPISRPAALLGDHILRVMAGEPVAGLQTYLMPELRDRCDDTLKKDRHDRV